jgi:small subunit ribosomal protein S6
MRGYSESVDAVVGKLTGVVTDFGGDIRELKNLGQQIFARAIDKKYPGGEYVQITFEADSSVPAAIREKLRLDKTINRVFIESC